MVYLDRIINKLQSEIQKLRVEATSVKLPTIRDLDSIVGQISGLEFAVQEIERAMKDYERLHDDDPEFSRFS